MDEFALTLLLITLLFVFLGLGVWVGLALLTVAWLGAVLASPLPIGPVLATTTWGTSNSWALAALPMFMWMGEILFRSRLSEEMFNGLAPWLTRLPGRLLHVNVLACGIFAAVSGSSGATTMTIGRNTLPALKARGYDETLSIGTLAGSGTLGLLIPPSIVLIVYGVATDQSIARLFVAGILPGIMLIILFMGYVAVWAVINAHRMPAAEARASWKERIYASRRLIPVVLLIVGILGSIYTGVASATDAASLGVLIALILSWLYGTLTWRSFVDGLLSTTLLLGMIALILVGSGFIAVSMSLTGIPQALAGWIAGFDLSLYGLIFALTVFFIILGSFLEGISIIVLTTSVVQPLIAQAGIDPIWFGIYLVIVIEMAQITPPVGFNLFMLQALTGRDIFTITRAALPFFFILVIAVAVITVWPEIATFLPQLMYERA